MTSARLAWWTATVALAAVVAPQIDPLLDHAVLAAPLEVGAGAILFVALARRGRHLAGGGRGGAARAARRARLVLSVKAAHEEAVWRALMLGFS